MTVPGGEPGEDDEKAPTRSAGISDEASPMAGGESDVSPAGPAPPSTPPDPEPDRVGEAIRPGTKEGRRGKPAKSGKLDYTAFVTQIEAIVSGESSKGAVAALMKLLKAGFSNGLKPNHLDRLLELLRPWPECSRFALNLYIETRKKHSSELMRSLRNRLLGHARAVADYPAGTDREPGGEEERDVILIKWVDAQLGPCGTEVEAEPDSPDLPRIRWILLCLLEEPAAIARYAAIYGLLDRLSRWGATGDEPHAELEFVTEIGGLFSTEKFELQRVRAAVRASRAARLIEQQCRKELRRAKALLDDARGRSDNLGRVAADLERQLEESRTQLAEQEKLCEHRGRELEEERRERLLDQEHWQGQSDQRLSKLASSIRMRLGHEISEAKISLSQEAPNVRMALDRLGRIEKALERLKDE